MKCRRSMYDQGNNLDQKGSTKGFFGPTVRALNRFKISKDLDRAAKVHKQARHLQMIDPVKYRVDHKRPLRPLVPGSPGVIGTVMWSIYDDQLEADYKGYMQITEGHPSLTNCCAQVTLAFNRAIEAQALKKLAHALI